MEGEFRSLGIKQIVLDSECFKTYPCQHKITIEYQNHKKITYVLAPDIMRDFGAYLPIKDFNHLFNNTPDKLRHVPIKTYGFLKNTIEEYYWN